MNNVGCNGAGCFEVKIWPDTAKFTNVIVARLRKCSDLVRLFNKLFVILTNVEQIRNVYKRAFFPSSNKLLQMFITSRPID